MNQVTVQIELAGELKEIDAYQVDEQNVIFYSEETIWLLGVKGTNQENVYKADTASVELTKGKFSDPELVIQFIIDTSKRISFWEYLLNYHDRAEDWHFDLLKFQ